MTTTTLFRATASAAALASALLMGGCGTAPTAGTSTPVADAGLLQHMDGVLRGASAARPVALRIAPQQVRTGEAITASVVAAKCSIRM